MDVAQPQIPEDKKQEARHIAAEKFRHNPDWVIFYREVLGVDGIIDQLFPTQEQRSQFERTAEYTEIQQMLARLRARSRVQKRPAEITRVITVRLPESLHESLRVEAHNLQTSMNKLCISKLLQTVADDLVPSDFQRREPDRAPIPTHEPGGAAQAETDARATIPIQQTGPAPATESPPASSPQPMLRPPMTGGRPF